MKKDEENEEHDEGYDPLAEATRRRAEALLKKKRRGETLTDEERDFLDHVGTKS